MLLLAQVQDTDCIVSLRPLVLGRRPGAYVTGARAVLQRVLYRWLCPAVPWRDYDPTWGCGLLSLLGATLSPRQLLGLRQQLEGQAKLGDFVADAKAPLSLVDTALSVVGSIKLVDGRSYPLEVLLSAAGPALDALGA